MYFQDASCLESHLNNDWAVCLKNLKRRQESHFQFLQYNKKIITKQRNEDDELFVKDEIEQHRQQYTRISEMSEAMNTEEKGLIEKYEDCFSSDDEISKLMGRVGARVLEICQSYLDKCKSQDKLMIERYREMKSYLVKLINQKDQINAQEIIKVVLNYSRQKLMVEVRQLKKLITGLENGEFQRLEEIYVPQPARPSLIAQKKKEKSCEKPKHSSSKDKANSIRQEIKKAERIRKQKQKMAQKMVAQLYSTMEISKSQLFEDMTGNPKQKSRHLFHEILNRNKFNQSQIVAFQAQEESFHEKVKEFKEMMERESKRIAEMLVRRPLESKEERQANFALKHPNQSMLVESCDDSLVQKKSSNRYRINSPKTKGQSKDTGSFSAVQSTNQTFSHFKFDTANQEVFPRSNRNKLPQLPNFRPTYRASSFDHRMDISRSRNKEKSGLRQLQLQLENVEQSAKDDKARLNGDRLAQRPKMILKNIEVGVEGVIKQSDPVMRTNDKKKVGPNPMEYTFYVRKTNCRFYEPRHNLIA